MKKYVLYTFVILASVLAGCEKFVTPEPTDRYSESTAFSSAANASLYVNSFYPILNYYGLFGGAYLGGNMYTDGLTDIMKTGGSTIGSNGAIANLYATNPSLITTDQNSLDIWSNAYYYIRLINEYVQGLNNSKLDATVKTKLSAEARFFRGYLYFLLIRNHGSVILITEPTTQSMARNTTDKCWDLVETDLDFAALNLPDKRTGADAGRITSGAAYAMKSRAMLYAERWQSSLDAAYKVISRTDGMYSLNASYSKAFGSYASGNKESILEFNYSYPQLVHNYDGIASPGGDDNFYEYGGDVEPTQELVELYEKAGGGMVDWSAWHASSVTTTPPWETLEPRFKATVLYNGATWKGRTIQAYSGGKDGWTAYPPTGGSNKGATVTGYYLKKYLDETHMDLVNIRSSQTMVEIRLAEVILNYAEAAHHLNKLAESLTAVNAIRSRAGLPSSALTGAALLAQIKKERTIELAGEGQHYWDLRRWKDAETTITGLKVHGIKVNNLGSSFSYDYTICDDAPRQFLKKMYAFPILSSELVNNTNCTQIENW
jgi:starch-binding outer membrane protein, SusD/RagB family